MEYLDAHKDEILVQLLEGEWRTLLPADLYQNVCEWFRRQQDKSELAVRFVCQAPKEQRFAVYFVCKPKIVANKVQIDDLRYGEQNHPLAVPPTVYDIPLYCMPPDLYSRILRKKRNG